MVVGLTGVTFGLVLAPSQSKVPFDAGGSKHRSILHTETKAR